MLFFHWKLKQTLLDKKEVILLLDNMLDQTDLKNVISLAIPSGIPTIQGVATQVINFLLAISGIIALIFLIYAGILYITAGNRPEQAQKAQTAVINVIIGIIVITLSYFLIRLAAQLALQLVKLFTYV